MSNSYVWADVAGNTVTGNGSNEHRITIVSNGGTATSVSMPIYDEEKYRDDDEKKPSVRPPERRISPKLYFSFVKSKLNKNEQRELKVRLTRLQTLTKDAIEIGQQALFEEYSKSLVMAVREQEALVCGYDRWVLKSDIEKFQRIAKDQDAYKSPVYFKTLEEFPRSVPGGVKLKIQDVKSKGLFDSFHVLYLDYTHEVVKTNKEKIREKDPILFGQFAYDKNKFYYIADWKDEYCDLTLNEFVTKMRSDDSDFLLNITSDIDNSFIRKLRREVDERHTRLESAKPSNFRSLMAQEDRKKSPWYKRMFGK